jgi:hypothetical protein
MKQQILARVNEDISLLVVGSAVTTFDPERGGMSGRPVRARTADLHRVKVAL